jgi:hypothetical protein
VDWCDNDRASIPQRIRTEEEIRNDFTLQCASSLRGVPLVGGIASETAVWAGVIKDAGIKAD